jgi:hypothetical protein
MEILESGIGEMIQPPDIEGFREWNRTHKTRKLVDKRMSEQEAISTFVYDGCYIGTELYGTVRCPMSVSRELVRQGTCVCAGKGYWSWTYGWQPGW